MNYFLSAILVALILWVASRAYLLERAWKDSAAFSRDPTNLQFVLREMIGTVARKGQWENIDDMRNEVFVAWHELDRLSVGHGSTGQAASYPQRRKARRRTSTL